MNTTPHQNRPEDTQNWTKLYLQPHDYRIYYVNITSPAAKSEEKQMVCRLKNAKSGNADIFFLFAHAYFLETKQKQARKLSEQFVYCLSQAKIL